MRRIQYKSTLALLGICVLSGIPAWSQSDSGSSQAPVPTIVGVNRNADPEESYDPDTSGDRMMTPPPVSGHAYAVVLTSEERGELHPDWRIVHGSLQRQPTGICSRKRAPISDMSYSLLRLSRSTRRPLECTMF